LTKLNAPWHTLKYLKHSPDTLKKMGKAVSTSKTLSPLEKGSDHMRHKHERRERSLGLLLKKDEKKMSLRRGRNLLQKNEEENKKRRRKSFEEAICTFGKRHWRERKSS
jgi:hypothetical protein